MIHAAICRWSIPDRRNSQCKGPKAGIPWGFQVCSSVVRAAWHGCGCIMGDRSERQPGSDHGEPVGHCEDFGFCSPCIGELLQ